MSDLTILLKLLPLLTIMGLGAALARCRVLDGGHVRGLSRYVLWIGFPALLVRMLSSIAPPGASESVWLGGYALGAGTPYLIGLLLSRLKPFAGEAAAMLPLACGAGNDAFLTLPLATSCLGPEAARLGGPLIALSWALLVPAGVALLHRRQTGDGLRRSTVRALINPVTVGAVVGVGLMATQTPPKGLAADILTKLAASCVPVGLVAVGAVAAMPLRVGQTPPAWAPILAAATVRVAAAPLCIWMTTTLSGAPPRYVAFATLIGGGPTAVTAFIQAQTYDSFAAGTARVVALSAAASTLTLTLLASGLN